MLKALNIASQAMRITSPNPRVGCVIVNIKGKFWVKGIRKKRVACMPKWWPYKMLPTKATALKALPSTSR
jgi:hypothetical protein